VLPVEDEKINLDWLRKMGSKVNETVGPPGIRMVAVIVNYKSLKEKFFQALIINDL
jgi:hypothetical protein